MTGAYGGFSGWGLGRRLVHGEYHKGGGGGDGGAAQRAAEEAARKAEARRVVNKTFGYGDDPEAGQTRMQREQQISSIAQSNLDLNRTALEEEKAEAARRLKFSLAGSGLRGGSTDAALAGKVQKSYGDQMRKAIAGADEIAANLKTADEDARLRMLSQVEAGADQSSVLAGAGDTLQANIARANAAAKGNIVSGAFDDIGASVKAAIDNRAAQRAKDKARTALIGDAGGTYQGEIGR